MESCLMTDVFPTLRELAAADSPRLNQVPLPPDGRYQLQEATMASVTACVVDTLGAGFRGCRAEDFPLFVIGWGRCRVGSTAITNLFGVAGVPAYYQPVKTIARFVLTGGRGAPFPVPTREHAIFAKEMAGPYVPYEALFNPVGCLLAAGWPADRLHLLVLDRAPRDSLDSWMAKWEEKIGRERVVENYLLSTLNYGRMRSFAAAEGVAVTHFPYEASRRPEATVSRLFDRLGIADRYSDRILTGWGEAGDLNSDHAMVRYPVEPGPYVVPGLHGSADEYRYRPRRVELLSAEELAVADSEPVEASFRTSVQAFCDELHVEPELRAELFG
jgi:hypothetical protein